MPPSSPPPSSSAPADPAGRIRSATLGGLPLDHVGIATPDLDAASAPYRALGLSAEEDVVLEAQGVRARVFRTGFAPGAVGGARLELLEPLDGAGPIARFLERRGAGLHHLALRTPDLDAEIARLQQLGARFVDPVPRFGLHGSRVVFLHPAWGGGVLLELVEPPQVDPHHER